MLKSGSKNVKLAVLGAVFSAYFKHAKKRYLSMLKNSSKNRLKVGPKMAYPP